MLKRLIFPLRFLFVLGLFLFAGSGFFFQGTASAEECVYRKLQTDMFHGNLLENVKPNSYEEGFTESGGVYCCEPTKEGKYQSGVQFSIRLNQKTAVPIYAEAESRLEKGSVMNTPDYSIYLDIVYMDGSTSWGVSASFNGRKDWEKKKVTFYPKSPIRSVSMYLLFRGSPGKVYFRNPRFAEMSISNDVKFITFDSCPVVKNAAIEGDGVRYYICDMEKDYGWYQMKKSEGSDSLTACGFALDSVKETKDGICLDSIRIRNTTNEDRCATLICAVPVKGCMTKGLTELSSVNEIDPKTPTEIMNANVTQAGCGRLSTLPLLGTGNAEKESWIGIHPDYPAVFRLFFNSATNELCAAYDLGFIPGNDSWELKNIYFETAPKGMRSAWNTYMRTFPAAFRIHLPKNADGKIEQGVWMPFAAISKVPNHEDFGFRFKEGNSETKWDDSQNILTYRYTEPMTWWMRLEDDGSGRNLLEQGIEEAERLAKNGHAYARAWKNSVMYTEDGKPYGMYRDTPWCKGIVWSLYSSPEVQAPSEFSAKWNSQNIKSCYETPENGDLDGEYIDSSEGYVTLALNYRREHLLISKTPLTFDRNTKCPVSFRGLTTYEYIRAIAKDVRGRGKSMMANSTPHNLFWLAPQLDILGTETNWKTGSEFRPWTVSQLLYRRMLCGKKPYCFLMNTDFTKFTYEDSERFMKCALAFGMFPGYFSADASTGHYFTRPELYDRDRPLFKKYIPLCKLAAEAGWECETGVTPSDESISAERFGNPEDGTFYLTLYNPGKERKTFTLTWSESLKGAREMLLGEEKDGEYTLEGGDTAMVKVTVQ